MRGPGTNRASRIIVVRARSCKTTLQRGVQRLLDAAREPKALWIIPEAGHIEGLSKRPVEYEDKVVNFFNRALLP